MATHEQKIVILEQTASIINAMVSRQSQTLKNSDATTMFESIYTKMEELVDK
jgi:hypothetical protein